MAAAASIQEAPMGAVFIARDRIRPNPDQPRQHFDVEELKELAASISEIGQVTPVELMQLPMGDEKDFMIVDGERRWLACGAANVDRLLAWVNPAADSEEAFTRSVAANFGRVGHTPIEIARAIKRIMAGKRVQACRNRTEQLAMVARIFARSPAWVHTHLGLLNLHEGVIDLMEPSIEKSRRIGSAIAMFLNTITDKELQLEIAQEVSDKGLNLRQARALTRKKAEEAGISAGSRAPKPYDHYRTLTRFMEVFRVNAETIMEMPRASFVQIFRRHPEKRQQELLKKIDATIDLLVELRQALARAQ